MIDSSSIKKRKTGFNEDGIKKQLSLCSANFRESRREAQSDPEAIEKLVEEIQKFKNEDVLVTAETREELKKALLTIYVQDHQIDDMNAKQDGSDGNTTNLSINWWFQELDSWMQTEQKFFNDDGPA